MFTGLIEEVGTIAEIESVGEGRRLRITARGVLEGMHPGDSVAVDGACQTVVDLDGEGFIVEAIGTTLSRTTFGGFAVGDAVNLERAMRLGDRVGGHLVQGHVDGVGEITRVRRVEEKVLIDVRIPRDLWATTLLHGSITFNGISLTVNALEAPDTVQVAIIPHTLQHTTLRRAAEGERVNVEADMIGKYVRRLLEQGVAPSGRPDIEIG